MAKGKTNTVVVLEGDTKITMSSCTNIVARPSNQQVFLTWTDPMLLWQSTTVRYKKGSAPTSETDGTLVITETTRNQYSETPLVVTGLTNGETYYFSVFPKSTTGIVNTNASQIVSAKPRPLIYTVKIDQSNSHSLLCCTYDDDAIGMTKGSSDWDDIFGYKPCIMKDGVVQGYLNPNDFTKYENGTDAPITDTDYDVMIEFPRRGLDISTEGDVITVSLTMEQNDSDFQYNAFRRGSTQKDYFYLGAYVATGSSSKLGSNSGLTPLLNTTIADFITYAHNRGTGYEIMGFYQWTYIQTLYVLKYGNLNSQVAVGRGYTNGSTTQTTGYCNAKGMCYGNTSSFTDRVKLFGLEDAWGNVSQWISGLYCNSNRNLLTTTDNFGVSTSSSKWEFNVSSGVSSDGSGWMTKAQGTNNGGFVYKVGDGSTTTFFSDYVYFYGSSDGNFPMVGGGYNYSYSAGIFGLRVEYKSWITVASASSRLMFL